MKVEFARRFSDETWQDARDVRVTDAVLAGRSRTTGYLVDIKGTWVNEDGLWFEHNDDERLRLRVSSPDVARMIPKGSWLDKDAEKLGFVAYPPAPFDPDGSRLYPFTVFKRLSLGSSGFVPALTVTIPRDGDVFKLDEVEVERTAFTKMLKVGFDQFEEIAGENYDVMQLRDVGLFEARRQGMLQTGSPREIVQALKRVAEQGCVRIVQNAGRQGLFLNRVMQPWGEHSVMEQVWDVRPHPDISRSEFPVIKALRYHGAAVNQRVMHAVLDDAPPPYSGEELTALCAHYNRKLIATLAGAEGRLDWNDPQITEKAGKMWEEFRQGI